MNGLCLNEERHRGQLRIIASSEDPSAVAIFVVREAVCRNSDALMWMQEHAPEMLCIVATRLDVEDLRIILYASRARRGQARGQNQKIIIFPLFFFDFLAKNLIFEVPRPRRSFLPSERS